MPQLPVSIPSSQASAAPAGQQNAAAASLGADGGDGLEGLQGQNFGSILGRQMKGVGNMLLEGLENAKAAGASDAAEGTEQAAGNSVTAFFQIDFMALAAVPPQAAAPHAPVQEGLGQAPADAAKPVLDMTQAAKAVQPAEIAGNGKNLPQGATDEKLFSDKLAALVDAPSAKADSPVVVDQLSANRAHEAMAAVAAAPRQVEHVPAAAVSPPVGSAAWGSAVGDKVVWMASQNHQVAELHLNPPSLGPLEVRLTVSNDQASAIFVSHHAAVREAVETALPRLREMLADSGIMLGNVSVSSESFSQQQAFEQGNGKERSGTRGDEVIAGPVVDTGKGLGYSHNRMVDIFA